MWKRIINSCEKLAINYYLIILAINPNLCIISSDGSTMLTDVRFVACQTRANRANRSSEMMYARWFAYSSYHHVATFMSRSETGPVAEPTRSLLINSRVVHLRIKSFSRNMVSEIYTAFPRALFDSECVAISQFQIYHALVWRRMTTGAYFFATQENS